MRPFFPSLAAAIAITLTGCSGGDNESNQATNQVSNGNPITAPADYLGAVGNAKQKAVKTVDIASLTQAIQMFQVSEDRLPKDLQELVTKGYIAKIPEAPYGKKIIYSPTSGQVSVVPQ
jgi:hypothetical protein